MTVQPDTNTPKRPISMSEYRQLAMTEPLALIEELRLRGVELVDAREANASLVARCEEAEKKSIRWQTEYELADARADDWQDRAERAERVVAEIPSPERLEWLVKWLDLTDALIADLGERNSKLAELRAISDMTRGTEVQDDLRTLAAALAASGPDTPEDA